MTIKQVVRISGRSGPRQKLRYRCKGWLLGFGAAIAAKNGWAQMVELDVDIPSGPARETVQQFIHQSGWRVLFDDRAVGSLRTNAVRGHLNAESVLSRMFAHTGCGCKSMPDRVFLVRTLP